MLEDDFTDVIGKALRGLELSVDQAATAAGVDATDASRLLEGAWDEGVARALAGVLQLDPDALAALPTYQPPVCGHPAITRLELPFGPYTVNAWLIDTGCGKLLIDTGCDVPSLAGALDGVCAIDEIRTVIITHNHRDHVGGLGLFGRDGVVVCGPGPSGSWRELRAGDSLQCGIIRVDAHDLSGHATPALGLMIRGLDVPVLATGDALFAGSMGGCQGRGDHDLARKTLDSLLSQTDPQTLLLPGHGPATRLLEETRSNPFLAAEWGSEIGMPNA